MITLLLLMLTAVPPPPAEIVDALTGTPLLDTVLTLSLDDGVRCVVAPCPHRSTRQTLKTDFTGHVSLPAIAPDLKASLECEGYRSAWAIEPGALQIALVPNFVFHDAPLTSQQKLALIGCLKSPMAALRNLCVRGFAFHRDEAANIAPELRALLKNENVTTREAAAQALTSVGAPADATTQKALTGQLGDTNLEARYSAAEALAAQKTEVAPETVATMIEWLKMTLKFDAQRTTSLTWPWKQTLPPLLEVLSKGTDEQRERASFVIMDIFVMRDAAAGADAGKSAAPVLLKALADTNSTVANRAAMALGPIAASRPEVMKKLEALAEKNSSAGEHAQFALRSARNHGK